MKRIQTSLLWAACLLATGATAQTRRYEVIVEPKSTPRGFEKVSIDKAVLGATQLLLWQNGAVEPDCSPRGQSTLTILRPPEHGKAVIDDQPFFRLFPPGSGLEACSQHKIAGHRAFYTADAGYTGRDRVVLQGSHSDGHVRQITVNIDVR